MEISKTTSKTGSLKALLLKAWRERWTDIQWGINIKTILPRGVSGDVYNLADCILQQATVGYGANLLVLSYLKHSLASHLVSFAAVLQRIAKFDAFHKPHCVLTLLEFLEDFLENITCRSKVEEAQLPPAISGIILWLLQIYHHVLSKHPASNTIQNQDLIEKSACLLHLIINTDFLLAMFHLAAKADQNEYLEISKKCQEISALMMMNTQFKPPTTIHDSLQVICNNDLDKIAPVNEQRDTVSVCTQAVLSVIFYLNPCCDTSIYVNELSTIQIIKGYSRSQLYCEVIKASLISLNDASSNSSKQSIWAAFTFLKLPQIINQYHLMNGSNSDEDYAVDVVEAFESLLSYTPLIDILDSKCSCNSINSLMESLLKLSLVREDHVNYFKQKRDAPDSNLQKLEPTGLQGSIPAFIFRAEPTLAGILKTMGADLIKIQDALYAMLCQVLSGKTLETILAVACVEGKLKLFVSKLIKFNECCCQFTSDNINPQSKTVLFDITFLILCAIIQEYSMDSVLDENGDSFFEQWVKESMVGKNLPKSSDQILLKCDPQKVDILLHILKTPDFDIKNAPIKLHELCLNVPGAIKEILFAWEQGMLSANDVRQMLDVLKTKATSLTICATAWLCAYMDTVQEEALLKPMNMVQQLQTPFTDMDLNMADNYKERINLMFQIVRKMQFDVHPPTFNKTKPFLNNVISKDPLTDQLKIVWEEIRNRGWLHIDATHTIDCLFKTTGPVWFVTNMIKELLCLRYHNDLERCVDLVFALFHLNIEKCTEALLLQVLPQYLFNTELSKQLIEPELSILAKLSVYCIYAALEYSNCSRSGVSRKRSRPEDIEDIEALCPTNKVRRLNDNTAESSIMFASPLPTIINNIMLKEPLQTALESLFKVFNQLAGKDGVVTPQDHFILQFLVYVVQCGKDQAQIVLQKLPSSLISTLIKALPEKFNINLVLRLYNISSSNGRQDTTRDLCVLRNMQLRPE